MKGIICLICLLVAVSFGTMIMFAQYDYRLNSNQLKDNWNNSRWDVNKNDPASSASNVSIVREKIAPESITLMGLLPYIIAAFLAIVAVIWIATAARPTGRGR